MCQTLIKIAACPDCGTESKAECTDQICQARCKGPLPKKQEVRRALCGKCSHYTSKKTTERQSTTTRTTHHESRVQTVTTSRANVINMDKDRTVRPSDSRAVVPAPSKKQDNFHDVEQLGTKFSRMSTQRQPTQQREPTRQPTQRQVEREPTRQPTQRQVEREPTRQPTRLATIQEREPTQYREPTNHAMTVRPNMDMVPARQANGGTVVRREPEPRPQTMRVHNIVDFRSRQSRDGRYAKLTSLSEFLGAYGISVRDVTSKVLDRHKDTVIDMIIISKLPDELAGRIVKGDIVWDDGELWIAF